jgi:hypothetical protein
MNTINDTRRYGGCSSTESKPKRKLGPECGGRLVSVTTLSVESEFGLELRVFGLGAMPISSALASCEWATGPLLREAQGQADLVLATRCALKLARRIEGDGRFFSRPLAEDANVREGISAGVAALAVWRSGRQPRLPSGGRMCWQGGQLLRMETAARICWRAVVESMSSDGLGESLPLSSIAEDWLASMAMPSESRRERLVRLKIERAARARSRLLVRRVEALKAIGGRGRRAMVCEKIGCAARWLLEGEDLDRAATLAGFKAVAGRGARGGGHSAGDRLIRACSRVGLRVVGSQRVVCQFRRDGHGVAPTVTWHRQRDFSGSRFPYR